MATYSLGIKGTRADSVPQVQNHPIADSAVLGGATVTIPTPGGMQQAMALNYQFIAKGASGVERLYTLDAERSTPTVPVLVPVR